LTGHSICRTSDSDPPSLESTNFGATGRTVSRLGFGGAPAGLTNYLDPYSPGDRAQRSGVIAAIQRAVELGVTYFDTAAGYGSGESERIFGEALDGHTESVYLATKVGHQEADVRASVERSLENLRVDCVDLVQIHGGDYPSDLADHILNGESILTTLESMRNERLIRRIGFTTENQNGSTYRFIESGRFDVMQICYNVLHMHAHEFTRPFGSIVSAHEAGIGVVTMRTLTSGMFQKWAKIMRPDDDFDYSPSLLQFVLSDPMVDVALVGMRTAAEVDLNVQILNDLDGRFDLEEVHRKYV
jgi:aryl-alcohol dehydrogenase-like predicted oxidoreductase